MYSDEQVLLHKASSSNEFSWHLIFADQNNIPHYVVKFVLEIKWRLRINDAETSSNFWHELYCRFATRDKPPGKLQPHEDSFGELAKCSETGAPFTNMDK